MTSISRNVHGLLALSFFVAVFASSDAFAERFKPGNENIAATAITINEETGEFSTLLAALTCTGLVPAVADPDVRLTVFAPVDAAFAAIGLNADNICEEGVIPRDALTNILLYHVTEGRRVSPSVINGQNKKIAMLNGEVVRPLGMGTLTINANASTANIAIPDVLASNGVIHAIDAVLLP
jgi:uncharacterized surface protein with fasciclin (FAS1) repeats